MTPGESAMQSVALNHIDFDTTGSPVLQTTMTTVVSCMLNGKKQASARWEILMVNSQTS